MVTCKDCLHNHVCALWRAQEGQDAKSWSDSDDWDCDYFDDKSRFVELPCKVGWIPVSERLPEIDQKVLIYTKSEIITCGWYTEAHGLAYNKGFETENGFMWLATASYWMPLPEPPEVDHDPN